MFARRIALSLAAVGIGGLILSGSGLVHAQTAPEASTRGLVGEIRELKVDSFSLIQNGTGEIFTVSLNGFDANAALTTVQIQVKPSRPTVLPFSGVVTSVENGTMSVVRPSGESMTVQIPSRKSAPQAGAVVMGFARASDSRSAPAVSIGLTTAEEMRGRLEGFLDEANSAASPRPEQAGTNPQERSARLAEILANHTAHQVAILQGVLGKDNLSNKARAAVTRAHSSAKVGLQRAREVAVLARAAVRDMGVRGEPEDTPGRGSAQLSDGS